MLWWGRWDLNPGSHAPQACILIHARRRPHGDTCFLKELNETEQAIIKTLTFIETNIKTENVNLIIFKLHKNSESQTHEKVCL